MANQDGPSAVNFKSEQGNADFKAETGQQAQGQAHAQAQAGQAETGQGQFSQAETGQASGLAEKVTEAAQNVNWNKVAVGAGAVAAVAGAAFAAKKLAGGSERDENQSSGSNRKKD